MKGYQYLIEAARLINDPRLQIEIYGEGEEEKVLQDLIGDLGLAEHVFLRGYVENPEDVLRAADCFVLPSGSHESCPAVVPEAMACGLPVITSDFGPFPEINVNGETGIVVPAGDVKALACAIWKLMGSPDLCNAMGQGGKKRVVEYFEVGQMVSQLICMYRNLSLLQNNTCASPFQPVNKRSKVGKV
jgi:glycosyltransferase involved in cell wall biosynthesis